jgi:hypothetical protein
MDNTHIESTSTQHVTNHTIAPNLNVGLVWLLLNLLDTYTTQLLRKQLIQPIPSWQQHP